MNIILTIDYSPWSDYSGGAQRSTHFLATAFARRGHNVHVIFTRPVTESFETPPVPYHLHWAILPAFRSTRKATFRPLSAWFVARTARQILGQAEGRTVIHSNGEEGGLIHRLRKRHSFGFISTPRHPMYPEVLLREEGPHLHEKVRLIVRDAKYLMQGSAARHADLCVPPSRYAAGLIRRAYGVDESKLRVVHNGVPGEFLEYGHLPEQAGTGPVMFFGRFHPVKGVDTLIEALTLFGTEIPETHVIGRGAEEGMLRDRIRNAGLGSRIRLLPWMTHDELGKTISNAGMVVLPSREENFSLAVLGAMAVGAPVISTNVGGTPEIISDGETGLLVDPDDPPALADAVRRLREDPAFARGLGAAGRERVRTEFTWDQAAERFEALYNRVTPEI